VIEVLLRPEWPGLCLPADSDRSTPNGRGGNAADNKPVKYGPGNVASQGATAVHRML
jgi:hypothetical protein